MIGVAWSSPDVMPEACDSGTVTLKVWGRTTALLQTPLVEVHRIDVRPEMRCSWHKHERKWNAFVLICGEMEIEHESGEMMGSINLRSRIGNFYVVPPGDYHRFVTRAAPAAALELYYPDTLSEDIIRRDVGGRLSPQE